MIQQQLNARVHSTILNARVKRTISSKFFPEYKVNGEWHQYGRDDSDGYDTIEACEAFIAEIEEAMKGITKNKWRIKEKLI